MGQLINHSVSIQIIPNRHWLAPGPGWAVLAGSLVVSGTALEADTILKIGLLWLLADPLLGTVWNLLLDQGILRQLKHSLLASTPLKSSIPYATKDSAAHNLSHWITSVQNRKDGALYTLFIITILACVISVTLGWVAFLYVLISLLTAFVMGKQEKSLGQIGRSIGAATVTFLLPYAVAAVIIGQPTLLVLLVGLAFWTTYIGLLQLLGGILRGDRLVILGPIAVALLLYGLTAPLPATACLLAALFALQLRMQTKDQDSRSFAQKYGTQVGPFLLFALLISTLFLGGLLG